MEDGVDIAAYLQRHHTGDWGDLSAGDKRLNDAAVRTGEGRIFSAYDLPGKPGSITKIWIITEADRASTMVLLPSEY
jgi:hypothetical protein